MDARVLVFSLGVTVLTAVLFGLAPVLGAAGTRSLAWMRQRDASRSAARARSALVVVEIALALVVLIGAGLVVKSFARLVDRDPGIDPTGVVAVQVRLSEATYGEGDRVRLFYASLFERLSALPGVTRTGAISTLPFTGGGSQSGMLAAGRAQDDTRRTDVNVVTPDYFTAMGIELREGRVFEERDDANASPVVVVDERFANHFWPGTSAVGQRVSGWGLHEAEVIGVVAHVRNYGVALDSREELYMNHAQRPFLAMRLIVRAERDPLSLVPDIRRIVAALDPDVPADDPRTMADIVGRTLGTARLTAVIGSGFAGLAVLLAAIGIYGVIAYTVTQRRREIGTRAALGALQSAVVAHVVARGLRLALAGVSIGTALAMGMTRLLQSQIHDVSRTDLSTFIVLPLLLLAIAAAASWLPARRAARISPLECLRSE
jgi:predicted permease